MKRNNSFEILSLNEVASDAAITLRGITPLHRSVLHSTLLPKAKGIPLPAVACLYLMTFLFQI